MGTPDDTTAQQLSEAGNQPGQRDTNPTRSVTDELQEAKVELALPLLQELRCVQTELERHVRVYLEAGERLVRCSDLLETLRHSPLSEDDWPKAKRDLDRTRPLAGSEAIRQASEELAQIAREFDEERGKANEDMRVALDPTQDVSLDAIQHGIYGRVWKMSQAAGQLTETCRSGAEDWLNRIGKSLSALFGRIDQQLEARASTYTQARAPSAEWGATAEALANVGSGPVTPSDATQRSSPGRVKGES